MEYNKEIKKDFGKNFLEYGIIDGNNVIFFLKVGQNGSIYGFGNKYLKIAERINETYGFTVIVASNPFDGRDPLDNGMKVIEEYAETQGFADYDIYFMGYSNGGLVGAWYGSKYPKIKRMLLVNSPFIELFKIVEGLKTFEGENITLVYGDLDQSFKYLPLLFPCLDDKIMLEIVNGADHHFKGLSDEFIKLPEKYLFSDFPKLKR